MVKGPDQEFLRKLCCLQTPWETTQPCRLSSPEHSTGLSSPFPVPGLCLSVPMASTDTTQPEHIQGRQRALGEASFLGPCQSSLQGRPGTWVTTTLGPNFLAWPQMCLIPAEVWHRGLGWPQSLSPELWCPCPGSVTLPCSSVRSVPEPLHPWLGCRLSCLLEPPAFAAPSLWLTAILSGKVNKTLHIGLLNHT